MTSRERLQTALNHQEADRIPFDLGGMAQSGIHRTAYTNLRRRLGLPDLEIQTLNVITQVARLHEDLQERLGIDAHLVYGKWADPSVIELGDEGEYVAYTDEWGVSRRMPKESGLYFDICRHPFDVDAPEKLWERYPWPDSTDPTRVRGLREEARSARSRGKFVVLMGLCPGITEMYSWLRGFERFYSDLAAEPAIVERFLQKLGELKASYWRCALSEAGEYVDAVNEADDLAGQGGLLMSVATYRRLIKPYHQQLIAAIKETAPHAKVLFHSCGAVRKLIPDFIEIGVEVLNPVQISAAGMDPCELKRDFGRDICFWGGGIDTQHVLQRGSPQEIRDEVRRNIEALAPGGGFIFSPVHIIQANVPPENIVVMWETLQDHGRYSSS